MVEGVFNKTPDKKLNSVDFNGHRLRKIETVKTTRWHITNMMEAVLEKSDLIVLLAANDLKESKTSMDVE